MINVTSKGWCLWGNERSFSYAIHPSTQLLRAGIDRLYKNIPNALSSNISPYRLCEQGAMSESYTLARFMTSGPPIARSTRDLLEIRVRMRMVRPRASLLTTQAWGDDKVPGCVRHSSQDVPTPSLNQPRPFRIAPDIEIPHRRARHGASMRFCEQH